MRFARLEDSGRSKPLAVVGGLGSGVDMKLDVEEGNNPDLIRMPANCYTDTDWGLPVQQSLVDRDLVGIVLPGSLDCMTTKSNLVAAEVENFAKGHYHCGGQGGLGNAEDYYRLYGDYIGAECCQEKGFYAIVPSLWFALHLGLR